MTHDLPIIVTRADEMVAAVAAGKAIAVLSIEHPGATLGRGGAPCLGGEGLAHIPQKVLIFWDTESKEAVNGPDLAQIEAGLKFIMDHAAKGPVLIHCHAGVARSTSMALGALALLYPDADETELVEKLLKHRPQASPNSIVLEMVDQLTNRGGRLLRAVMNHPVIAAQRAKTMEARKNWIKKNPDAYKQMHPEKFPKP